VGCGKSEQDAAPGGGQLPTAGKPIVNSIDMKLTLIPAGEFQMGSPNSDSEASINEKPQHLVKITQPFYLGVYEVTQEQYERVMEQNPSDGRIGGYVPGRVGELERRGRVLPSFV
jgi:formylglycine-generating enzyme required for sulfatase activity